MVTVAQLLIATGGKLLQGNPDAVISEFSTDSRAVASGAAFFALSGERFDGHAYVERAIEAGAACVVISKPVVVPAEATVIQVEDVLTAYQNTAAWYRRQFNIPIIAVTGSNGKTSTKEIIAAVLAADFTVLKTQANFNNDIGLPKTLLQLTAAHEAAVVEMGMRQLGEIRLLATIAQPTIGVITNVGETHIERLGSIENIARAKQELIDCLTDNSLAVLNGDDPYVRRMADKSKARVVFYGEAETCDYRLLSYALDAQSSTFCWREGKRDYQAILPAAGKHQLMNAMAAIAVARNLGMSPEQINQALSTASLGELRQQVMTFGAIHVLNDTYNASPLSMEASLKVLAVAGAACRRVALLGDMLELGDQSERAHYEVGRKAAQCGVSVLAAVGEFAFATVRGASEAGVLSYAAFADKEAAWTWLAPQLSANDFVLLKGSRGLKMETFLPLFDVLFNSQGKTLGDHQGDKV